MTNTSIFGEGFARNFSRLTPNETLLNFANEQGLDTQDPDEILHAILYSHPEHTELDPLSPEYFTILEESCNKLGAVMEELNSATYSLQDELHTITTVAAFMAKLFGNPERLALKLHITQYPYWEGQELLFYRETDIIESSTGHWHIVDPTAKMLLKEPGVYNKYQVLVDCCHITHHKRTEYRRHTLLQHGDVFTYQSVPYQETMTLLDMIPAWVDSTAEHTVVDAVDLTCLANTVVV